MRILHVHNRHAGIGGMEVMYDAITRLLRARGHTVVELQRDNAEISGLAAKLRAFGSAIYSPGVYREVRELIERQRIDVAHVHNIYPQFSVSLLDACADSSVPVILHVHDYKLTCPTAQHLRHGVICDKCTHRGGEIHCAIHNCRGSRSMSVAYAIRNAVARASGKIHDNVALFACCSQFVRDLIVAGGYPAEKSVVLNNFFDLPPVTPKPPDAPDGAYIASVGRISPEKGIDVLVAAGAMTGLPIRIAGEGAIVESLRDNSTKNVQFVGQLSRAAMNEFLDNARIVVVPSIWWEAFGLVAAEAMSRGIPVIASKTGGLAHVVDDGVTGMHIPMNDAPALAMAMKKLWDDAPLRKKMGAAGREKALRLYTADAYYAGIRLMWSRVVNGYSIGRGEEAYEPDERARVLARAG
jgi:glycosyltransferase involved in cell wall biosynthesis